MRATTALAVVAAFTFLTACVTSSAAEPAVSAIARPALEAKVSELIDLIGNGRIDAMLDRIGPIPDPDRPAFEQIRQRLINLYGNAGKFGGFDIAGYKVLTPRFQVAYVMVYFDKRPALFEFGFYRVNDTWRPQTFAVETNFKALLDTLPMQR
ncbi:MAG TPA: hypothetical protein VG326_21005 [Tepidisphaeraceae bacterium]|jgi:hypothetical protein|nr:hypothetical protein [Tepidisphaeraceae bacterium]